MVSLVFTVLNEEDSISLLMEDILMSTHLPDEIVIVDGGSKDNTVSVIEGYRNRCHNEGIDLKLIEKPGANIANGRNIAIAAARGPCIAVTDGGCRLESNWLQRLVEPLLANRVDFVGGFFKPVAHTHFQKVLAGLTTAADPINGFLPSSRSVAFEKSLWEKAGGYPEWLRWGEDTLFNRLCLKAGASYEMAADAVVFWEVRSDFRSAFKQYFRYAFGDGLASRFCVSHMALQGVYWGSLGAGMVWGLWALIPVLLYPIVWMLRRKVTKLVDMPLAYAVALSIQSARFLGFIWGFGFAVKKIRWGRSV